VNLARLRFAYDCQLQTGNLPEFNAQSSMHEANQGLKIGRQRSKRRGQNAESLELVQLGQGNAVSHAIDGREHCGVGASRQGDQDRGFQRIGGRETRGLDLG
jgi:hypothetical protein